jgi:glycine/D-amino acid oxidase-like deaminating enzyme
MDLKSGYPFSLVRSGLPYDYPVLTSNTKADVVVLGGGISGALTSYYLVKKNVDCLLLDKRTIGLGSTCASTSLLQYEIDVPLSELVGLVGYDHAVRAYKLCEQAIYLLGDLATETGLDAFDYRKSLYYAAAKKDLSWLKDEFNIRKKSGFKVRWLEGKALAEQNGFNSPGAILSDTGAQTDAYLFTHALLQRAMKKGLRVFDRTHVKHIDHSKRNVTLKTEDGHSILAKTLIYATGYEVTDQIGKDIVDLQSTYATISEQVIDLDEHWKKKLIAWNTADPYLYFRTTKDKRILVGGRDEPFSNPEKRDALLPFKSKQLVKDFKKQFPDIPFKPEFSWTGTFGATKDGLPFIGAYPKLPHALFSLGFGVMDYLQPDCR